MAPTMVAQFAWKEKVYIKYFIANMISTMKFVLLISMLAVSVFAKSYNITVEGTIKCHEPFMFNMRIFVSYFMQHLELDKYKHDFVAECKDPTSESSEKQYRLLGKASDMLQSEVEPLLFFWHTCGFGGKGDGTCVCKDLGNISADLNLKLDIDFTGKGAMKGFRHCKQACIKAMTGDRTLYGGM
ncbi:hypothetical protein PRIPAC_73414 [Pristionchus pacificus]|uniref:Uncharacterized protein n=1 Tax=Pristionchus pacificus TaxID=54126 RepID=A0A2A6BEJ2_PRIPA|nr:hypothetical protein PRIPAC_73414 [Pristionchus pacificus]|eukprot:PDM64297.1 hypothetical protein PRIPAC_52553 [Pristionchus pacificus]